jgi:hypothetical protein
VYSGGITVVADAVHAAVVDFYYFALCQIAVFIANPKLNSRVGDDWDMNSVRVG